MRQKSLYDGTKIPAIWQGGSVADINDEKEQVKVWIEGVRFGCNAIDTSERYGNGLSERLIGEVLKHTKREDVFIATKVAPEHLSGPELVHALKRSLKRLGTDYVDLYQIHWNNPEVPLESTLDAMLELRGEGKIRHIGVCNFTLPQIEECNLLLNGELATVQMEYNLLNRVYERDIIPYCQQNGVVFLAYSPLNSGKMGYVNDVLKSVAHKNRQTTGQVTLNWLTSQANVCAIAKTRSLKHLIENAQSTEFDLDEEDSQRINDTFRQNIVKLKPSQISCATCMSGVEGNVPGYKTLEEATANKNDMKPGPVELSKEIAVTRTLSKPILVHKHGDSYELIGGNIRYWAWVIAFGTETEIECIIK